MRFEDPGNSLTQFGAGITMLINLRCESYTGAWVLKTMSNFCLCFPAACTSWMLWPCGVVFFFYEAGQQLALLLLVAMLVSSLFHLKARVKVNTTGALWTRRDDIFTARKIRKCYLSSRYSTILLNKLGQRGYNWQCVDLWSGLTSSTHLCRHARPGHCMIFWPCCGFMTFSPSLDKFFILHFLFWRNIIWVTFKAHNFQSYPILCSALGCVPSHVQ